MLTAITAFKEVHLIDIQVTLYIEKYLSNGASYVGLWFISLIVNLEKSPSPEDLKG